MILGWFENFGVVYPLSTSDDKPMVGESRHHHLQHAFKGHPSRLERVSTELHKGEDLIDQDRGVPRETIGRSRHHGRPVAPESRRPRGGGPVLRLLEDPIFAPERKLRWRGLQDSFF